MTEQHKTLDGKTHLGQYHPTETSLTLNILLIDMVGAFRTEPFFHGNSIQRWIQTVQMISRITSVAEQKSVLSIPPSADFAKSWLLFFFFRFFVIARQCPLFLFYRNLKQSPECPQ